MSPAASVISPALVSLAPSLGFLVNGGVAGSSVQQAGIAVDPAAAQAAQDAIRRVSDMLKSSNPAQAAGLAGGQPASLGDRPFQMDVDINDSSRKGHLTKKQTQEDIMKATGVSILIRGRYKPPGDSSTDEKPLHLHLEARTEEDMDRAESAIREIMGPPAPAATDVEPSQAQKRSAQTLDRLFGCCARCLGHMRPCEACPPPAPPGRDPHVHHHDSLL